MPIPVKKAISVPDSNGLPSVQERIDLYCREVQSRGGTPPTLTAGCRLRHRRFTAPQLDCPDSLLAARSRDRSSSSTDVFEMSHLQGAALIKAAKEGNVNGVVNGASGGMRKQSALSVREIQVDFGNGRESDSNDGGDDDAGNDLMVPVPMTVTGQMELQRLREENRLLHKQLQAVQSGEALLPCLPEDDPRVKNRSLKRRKLSKAAVLDLVREVGTMDKPHTYTQVFKKFLLSEGQYLNNLLILTNYFVQPFKLLVAYKPAVLSFTAYQSLFLNCEELVRFHKMFHSSLSALKDVQDEEELLWRFLHILESNLPYITVYGPFLASQQPIRKKLFHELMKNSDFSAIVTYQEQAREKSLKDLLDLPYTRLQSYIDTLQLTELLPMKTVTVQARFSKLILFLSKQEEMLRGEPGEWAEMKKKLNHVLEKLTPDSVVPVEVFDPQTLLKKSGQLEVKENGKVVPKQCFLFSRHFAVATVEKLPNQLLSYRIDNPGFITLCGAKVYSKVDVDGHEVQDDYETGRPMDREAFLVKLPHGRSYVLKAHKPANWVSSFEESIKEAEQVCNCRIDRDRCIVPNFEGSLAAASEEKLLARLTNLKGDLTSYLRVFFVTYPVFTTSKAVLGALATAVSQSHVHEEEQPFIHPVSPHIASHHTHNAHSPSPIYNCYESDNSECDSPPLELKSPRLSPPHMHNILTDPAATHLTIRSIPRNLSIISERSASSLSGEAAEMSDDTPLVTPRESTVYIDAAGLQEERQQEEESLSAVHEEESPPPAGLIGKRKMSISLPDIASLAETAGLQFASGTPTEKEPADSIFESESEDSEDSEASSVQLTATSDVNTPSTSPTPVLPSIVQTLPSPQMGTPPKVATGRGPLSASFSSSSRPQTYAGRQGAFSLPSSPQHTQSHDFKSDSKSRSNQAHSWHLGPPPSPSPNSPDAKTDKGHSHWEGKKEKESEGRKEAEGGVAKRPSFKHQASHDSSNILKKHKKPSSFNIKGMYKRWIKRSTSSKRDSGAEEDALSNSHGSIASSYPIGPEEDEQEMVEVLLRVMNVVEFWIEHHYKDFSSNPELKMMMLEFLQEFTEHPIYFSSSPDLFECLREIKIKLEESNGDIEGDSLPVLLHKTTSQDLSYLELMLSGTHSQAADLDQLPPAPQLDLLSHKPQEVAQQLTLLQFAFYTAIDRREMLNAAWKGKHRARNAPNILRAIEQGNKIVMWVCTEVIQQPTEHERATAIEFFIRVAEECFRHSDMHCLIMVHSALSSSAVNKLKGSWAHVDRKLKEKLDFLRPYCETTGRCKKMREHVKKLDRVSDSKRPACLPYLGAYLDQIWSLEMSKSTKNSQGLINFGKMQSLCDIIDSFLKFQSKLYTFAVNVKLIRYIYNARYLSDEQLYCLSSSYESERLHC